MRRTLAIVAIALLVAATVVVALVSIDRVLTNSDKLARRDAAIAKKIALANCRTTRTSFAVMANILAAAQRAQAHDQPVSPAFRRFYESKLRKLRAPKDCRRAVARQLARQRRRAVGPRAGLPPRANPTPATGSSAPPPRRHGGTRPPARPQRPSPAADPAPVPQGPPAASEPAPASSPPPSTAPARGLIQRSCDAVFSPADCPLTGRP